MNLLSVSQDSVDAALKQGALTAAVIGIGHIGLPLALRLAQSGAKVRGVVKTRAEADAVNRGEAMFYEPGLYEALQQAIQSKQLEATDNTSEVTEQADVIFICVGTPVDEMKRANLRDVREVCRKVGKALSRGKLVVLRSTVPPGFTEEVAEPLLEKSSGLSSPKNFGLAFCPERLVQGQALQELVSVPQIIGGVNKESTDAAERLFSALGCQVIRAANARVAEMAKLFDNVYRDVNIALANELALICEQLGIDIMQVIEASNTGPRTRVLIPGSGTGGSCLNKDPYILLEKAHKAGVHPRLIPAARRLNETMPQHTVGLVQQALAKTGKTVKGAKIAVLGLSFKKDTDDLRDTVARPVITKLRRLGADLTAYDPLVRQEEARKHFGSVRVAGSLEEAILKADCLLILTDHQEFRKMNFHRISNKVNRPVAIVDGRQVVNPRDAVENGFLFSGIGRPTISPGTP